MTTPTLVTMEALAALDAAGIRFTLVDTDPEHTTLRFDHQALDELANTAGGDRADLRADRDDAVSEARSLRELVRLYRKATGITPAEIRKQAAA